MTGLLMTGLRKAGVRNVLLLLLLLVALGSLTLGLRGVVRGLDSDLVLTVAVAGMVAGLALARSPLPGWLAGVVVLTGGVETVLVRVGNLGGTLMALAGALLEIAWSVWNAPRRGLPDIQPALAPAAQVVNGVGAMLIRSRDWMLGLASGAPSFDPVAAALAWSLVVWLLAAWLGWAVVRRERVFLALAPLLMFLGAVLAYTGASPLPLVPLLGALLLLMPLVGHSARERHWRRIGIGFSEEIRFDLGVWAVSLTLVLVTAAALTPSLSVRDLVQLAQQFTIRSNGEASRLPGSLGLIQQPGRPSAFDLARAPGLPRERLIGAGPELSQELVMLVRSDDLSAAPGAPLPRDYWRSSTYDQYTGYGWYSNWSQVTDYSANQAATTANGPARRVIHQEVQFVSPPGSLSLLSEGMVYAAGTLVSADHDYRVAWRSAQEGDAFSANIQAGAYRAESFVSAPTEAQLEAAGGTYPKWVRDHYLALPDEVPPRVLALARDLTATQLTPYDRARAVERYLRGFPYTLDLPSPPAGRDVVDYFLFDLKRGYCDYYASAMVVLARAAGLPARLVVGFAPGRFDAANVRWLVTAADAHSWPEVYFPDYGWVEFEPTAGRPAIDRESDWRQAQASPTPPGSAPNTPLPVPGGSWWMILLGGCVGLGFSGAVLLVADDWRLRRLPPPVAVREIYRRLVRAAPSLGLSVRAADTPYDFAAAFTARLCDLAAARGAEANRANREVCRLADLYAQSRYSPRVPGTAARSEAVRTWQELRRRLWLAWLWRVLGKWRSIKTAASRRTSL